jgi:hypothetical protein
VQVTLPLGTVPSLVGEENAQFTVSTTVPIGCSTVIVALVNATSVMSSVESGFGQSGAPGIGETGASVVTLNPTLPFLISDAGIDCMPVMSAAPPTSARGASPCRGQRLPACLESWADLLFVHLVRDGHAAEDARARSKALIGALRNGGDLLNVFGDFPTLANLAAPAPDSQFPPR